MNELGVSRLHHRATESEQLREDLLHRVRVIGVDLQPQIGSVAIGAANTELLNLEAAPELDHGVEDLLHDVGVDEMSLGFHALLQWEGLAVRSDGCGLGFQANRIPAIGAETRL